MVGRVHLSRADVSEVEEGFVLDALRSGWVAPLGPHVDAFEREIAARIGVSDSLALSSGTAALHLALLNLGAGPGTAVVVSSMTFAASANAIIYTGAVPVFVDSNLSDGNVDATLLLQAVDALRDEGTRVVAVMVVDLFGRCADYDALVEPLRDRGIPLLEDAAESLGSSQGSTQAGAFGQASVLSFNGNKVMTTSGGGMLLSNDSELIQRARYLSAQARQPVAWYEHVDIGYNYRLSNILAALGRGQLVRLDSMIARRRAIRRRYEESINPIVGLRLLGGSTGSIDQENCWLSCIILDPKSCAVSPGQLITEFAHADIEARYLWKPLHTQPVFRNHRAFLNGNSQQLFETGVTLPSGSSLTTNDIDRVIDILAQSVKRS